VAVSFIDHLVRFDEEHLNLLVREYVEHFHYERPHQGIGNVPPEKPPDEDEKADSAIAGTVRCRERLGGLPKHCHHDAA